MKNCVWWKLNFDHRLDHHAEILSSKLWTRLRCPRPALWWNVGTSGGSNLLLGHVPKMDPPFHQ
jgi:hypothetical protein